MDLKPKVFLTSNVFSSNEIGSNEKIDQGIRDKISELWNELNSISNLKVYTGRFPKQEEIEKISSEFNPHIIGCHLSHQISSKVMKDSNLIAVSTCTAGFNHISRTDEDKVIITHTPGVLYETVADYTIALIMSNLRNLIDLHSYVWNEKWSPEDKWDLDQNLSSIVKNKTIGIVGLGEIGKEVVRKLTPWGLKIIYYDIK
ncbi:MAG: NAD(P)-dependent oxidoreductase, partial [Candidatus Lokiarchaeota archaeon]